MSKIDWSSTTVKVMSLLRGNRDYSPGEIITGDDIPEEIREEYLKGRGTVILWGSNPEVAKATIPTAPSTKQQSPARNDLNKTVGVGEAPAQGETPPATKRKSGKKSSK